MVPGTDHLRAIESNRRPNSPAAHNLARVDTRLLVPVRRACLCPNDNTIVGLPGRSARLRFSIHESFDSDLVEKGLRASMRILVIVNHVPDSRSAINVVADGSGIELAGVKFVCDPFDEFAVAQSSRLREIRSDVEEIAALTVGPPEAAQTLRTALAMGADRGIHVFDTDLDIRDEILRARVLAAAIAKDGSEFDVILCGKQSIDNDAGELGPALAEFLGWPHIGAVTKLEFAEDGQSVRANRRIEGAEEIVESSLPILITCDKGLIEPRLPTLPNLMKAKKKPVETFSFADLEPHADAASARTVLDRLQPPSPRPTCRLIDGGPEDMAKKLVRVLHEECKVI